MSQQAPRTRRSFSARVGWAVAATTTVAVICVSLALAVINHRNLRNATYAALQAQTDIAAINSGAPLVFGDPATAREVLEAFKAMPSVTVATLFTLDGRPFARYQRDADSPPPLASGRDLHSGLTETKDHVVSITDVAEKGQVLGRLRVVYDLSALRQQLWDNLRLAGLISLATIALALLLSLKIAKVVTRPLELLTRTAQRVSDTRDYRLRAPAPRSDDEIGAFSQTFNEMLEQIQHQDAELRTARTLAEASNRLKDEFLATLSHELRTPMTPILGWAQILRRIARDDPKVLQAAEVIERNALLQTRLVDDLLDMSRIISGKIRLEVQPVRLQEVVAGAVEAVREAALARDIALETRQPANLPLLRGDPQRLQQVFWNLLSNAIKFTPTGGRVDVRVSQRPGAVVIQVCDTGQGIPREFLAHVFERFRQIDSSITRDHGGLGLGLAIVRQLVELHGGTVSVDSPGIGQGTTFTVILPLAGAPQAEPDADVSSADSTVAESPATRDQDLQGLRIVAVDNEADAREWLGQLLADRGAQVRLGGSAEEALQLLQAETTDVLVSDIGMPGTDGYALIAQVRALDDPAAKAVPAIALTAFARNEDRERALRAGYQNHLGKPVDAETLVAAILAVLD